MKLRHIFLLFLVVSSLALAFYFWAPNDMFSIQTESELETGMGMREAGIFGLGNLQPQIGEASWQVQKATGQEAELTFWKLDAKDKKTELGWIPPAGCTGWTDQFLYDQENNLILDDKSKSITLKCESSKCGGQDCYHISLTDAASVNIDEFIQLGENSQIVTYQNQTKLNYQLDFADVNITLFKNISGNYTNQINDVWVYHDTEKDKFGANDSSNEGVESYKYVIESDSPILKKQNFFYEIGRASCRERV